jgi:tyrosinase
MVTRKRKRNCNKPTQTPLQIYGFIAIGFFVVATTFQPVEAQGNRERSENWEECPLVSERRSWNDLSCDEQDAFLTNIRRLKRNGVYDAFARVHIENERASHGTPEFLPWHRWFIYQFELAIRSVADPPFRCMSLPYWDWELDAGNEGMSSVFSPESFSVFEGRNRYGRCQFQINRGEGAGSCLRRVLNFDFPVWGEGRLVALIRGYSQYGDDFPNDPTRVNGFRAALEGGPHAALHNFIGGSMADHTAPNDPLFWIHHANVDRIWSLWQDYHGHTNAPFLSYHVPQHYEGSLLDVPMPFGYPSSWDFQIRNLRTPTPREVLSNSGHLLNVRYVHRNPIPSEPGYTTNRQWFGTPPILINQCLRRLDINNPRHQLQERSGSEREKTSGDSRRKTTNNNQNGFLRGLSKSVNLQRSSIFPLRSIDSERDNDKDTISVEKCLKSNHFHRPQDREQWNNLCRELPTLGSRLNELAIRDCKELGQPRSALDDYWIERMGMSNQNVAFDCYHVADENERPSI